MRLANSSRLLSIVLLVALGPGAPLVGQTEESEPMHHPHEEHQHTSAEHEHKSHAGRDEGHGDSHGDSHGDAHSGHGLHHDFSDVERWSARFDDPARDEWQRPQAVVKLMQIESGMTAVDIGAGTGYFMPHLAAAVGDQGRVLALDVEPAMVEHMTDRAKMAGHANVEARHIPYDDPQLAAGSVDRILIVNTWHHIDARPAYAARLAAALGPDGQAYVVDFTKDSPEGPPVEHRLTPEQVIEELEQGGLRAQLVAADLPRQYVVVAQR